MLLAIERIESSLKKYNRRRNFENSVKKEDGSRYKKKKINNGTQSKGTGMDHSKI